MARIMSLHANLASANPDENSKLSKLKTLTPAESHTSMAIPIRNCESYEGLLQIIEAQMLDPLAGMARGEKAPGLSGLGAGDEEDWSREHAEG